MSFTKKEYALLRGGPEGIAKWNAVRKRTFGIGHVPAIDVWNRFWKGQRLSSLAPPQLAGKELKGQDLTEADLTGADLTGADLTGADLTGADLTGARLVRTILERADLTGADLTGADLTGAIMIGAILKRVDMQGLNLGGMDLTGADLEGANLKGVDLHGLNLRMVSLKRVDMQEVNLCGAVLERAVLAGANLRRAVLTNALLKWTDLTDATVEDADITGVVIHELRGLPKPPSRLRLQRNGQEVILTGSEAANFFVLPAVVEVYLTRTLTEMETGALQFHFGEVHANGKARDVYLVGHRREHDGSVLRFQGPTYEAVYAALPDLLAPFRTTAAIDWKATLDSIPKDSQPAALVTLAEAAMQDRRQRWPMAEKLAQVLKVFAHAEVRELKEGRSQGMVIKVATSKAMLQRLDPVVEGSMTLKVQKGGRVAIMGKGEVIEMGDNTSVNAGGAIVGAAIGTNANVSARDVTAEVNQTTSPALTELAGAVKQVLALLADTPLTVADHAKAKEYVEDIQAEATTTPGPEGVEKIKGWLDSLTKWCKPAADLIRGAKVVADALKPGG